MNHQVWAVAVVVGLSGTCGASAAGAVAGAGGGARVGGDAPAARAASEAGTGGDTLCAGADAQGGEVVLAPDVRVRPLPGGFWLHVTKSDKGVESNGVLAPLPDGGVLLVDTPWSDAQAERLLDFAAARLGGVRDAVVTHAHPDRNGGVGALRSRGLRVMGLDLTAEKARAEGSGVPDVVLQAAHRVLDDPRGFEVFYPGPGHTLDNVVVAFPQARLLVGGCLVKSAEAGAGYMGEAFAAQWPAAVEALRARYGAYDLVVPGHGPIGPPGPAFERSVSVAREEAAREARAARGTLHADVPAKPDATRRFVIYVHGLILEQQGRHAVSPVFGRYEYDAVLEALVERGFEVIAEVRGRDVGDAFAARLVEQVRRLRAAGVPAERITLLGASRGGHLALAAAAELQHPGLSIVVLAGCGQATLEHAPQLRGRVLSIYDSADRLDPECRTIFGMAPQLTVAAEIVLKLGHDHGLVYRPYAEWLDPATAWARGAPAQ